MKGEFSEEGMEFLDMRMRAHCDALRQRLEEEFDAKLAKLETLFFDQLEAIEATLAAMSQGQGQPQAAPQAAMPPGLGYILPPQPGVVPGKSAAAPASGDQAMEMCRSLTARLSLLEESFARFCNVVGRNEQELEMLREDLRAIRKG